MKKRYRHHDFKNNVEPFNRICPICGEKIRKNDLLHQCKKEILDEINEQTERSQEKEMSFEDKLRLGYTFLDPDTFLYDQDEGVN